MAQVSFHDHLRSLAQSTSFGMIVTDAVGRIEWVNKGFELMSEYPLAECKGRKPGEFLQGPLTDPQQRRHMHECIQAGLGFRLQLANYSKSGRLYWCDIECHAIYSDEAVLTGFTSIQINITEAKSSLEEQRRLTEEHLTTLDAVPGIVWSADARTFAFSYVSKMAVKILGYPFENWFTEKDFWINRIHPDDRSETVSLCHIHTTNGENHELFYRMIAADGSIIWIHDIAHVQMQDGLPIRLYGVMVNITEQVKAREHQKLQHAKLSRALFAANMSSWEYNERTRQIVISELRQNVSLGTHDLFERQLDFSDWILGIDADDRIKYVQAFQQFLENGSQELSLDFRYQAEEGNCRWMRQVGQVVQRDAAGEVALLAGVTQDITVIRAEQERRTSLEQKLKQAEQLATLGAYTGGIVHDLNNLHASIHGCVQLTLLELPEDSRSRESLNIATVGIARAKEMLGRLLRVASGQAAMKQQDVQLDAFIRETASLIASSLPSHVQLKLDLEPTPKVIADEGQLLQVLLNLTTNAAHAIGIQPGIITLSCREIAAESANLIQLAVTDNGCGMSEATRSRLFEPFFSTKKASGKGTGIGLSVVKTIVMEHGGSIDCTSQLGCGTTFRIALPKPSVGQTAKERNSSALPTTQSPFTSRPAKILVVDDDPAILSFLGSVLKRGAHQVTEYNPSEALASPPTVPEQKYDLVICDLILPKMNGLEVVQVLRRKQPRLPVIIMSGDHAKLAELRNHPGITLLAKPFDVQRMLEVVNTTLSSSYRQIVDGL